MKYETLLRSAAFTALAASFVAAWLDHKAIALFLAVHASLWFLVLMAVDIIEERLRGGNGR